MRVANESQQESFDDPSMFEGHMAFDALTDVAKSDAFLGLCFAIWVVAVVWLVMETNLFARF